VEQAIGATAGQFTDAPAPPAGQAARSSENAPSATADLQGMPDRHIYAGREWSSEHPLNVRVSIPIGAGRYYVTLVAGRERRARARLALDRRQHPLATPGNALFLAFVTTIATVGSVALFYLLLAHIFGWSGRLML